ncbi:opine metallophore biosynthesis dehydrogenase [Priestia megaterium]|uniref:opine metallophore biosynthesis dehydrogenase n=1 Tax=Priestia megaterium TaxID=1404 RepID=UPI00203E836E|nr:opine metallophore biosynthesis dehydrogenase [Priestia megaterium]MCM3184527.1 opine metallophore biosynthesis dehydrogenase [Priestia megaterium]MCM3194759.1 opine metallophore biosynthesis dehydrogenase [Priestia megaterium]
MELFKNILLLGTGPTTLQLGLNFKKALNSKVGIAGRPSIRSEKFFSSLVKHGHLVEVSIQNRKHEKMQGHFIVDDVFFKYEEVIGTWDTLVLAVTTDAYLDVLKALPKNILQGVQRVILISPTLGSNYLVHHYVKQFNPQVEVMSFSTYYGDTRWLSSEPSNQVLTTAIKKKIYIGSTQFPSDAVEKLVNLYKDLGLTFEIMKTPIEAETRNISLYVHPPLFMNEFSLRYIFKEEKHQKYVYKIYPEGPITPLLMKNMLNQWKEIMKVLSQLNVKQMNLLKFMTEDNYPVRRESLSLKDIENFNELKSIHQQYLLYVRYASLLVDPFSEPDEKGRYFDFSAVPIQMVFMNKEKEMDIPRMPKEDYYRLKMIQSIARYVESDCPTIDRFLTAYEDKVKAFSEANKEVKLSSAFSNLAFEEDIQMIYEELDKSVV